MQLAKLLKPFTRPANRLRALVRAQRGSMAPMLALTLPVILMVVVGSIDFSMAVGSKTDLQDAADAASLAVAVATAANPNTPETTLKQIAAATLASNFKSGTPSITDFHVCAPVQNDCVDGTTTLKSNTVALSVSAPTTCTLAALEPSVCGDGTPTVNARATTVIGFGATMQLNIVMDSSGSMIVGATPNDVQLIENWMGATSQSCTGSGHHQTCSTTYPNWNAMKPDSQGPSFPGDNPPCAFACHDLGASTTSANMQEGLNNAHTAGATTRFDVMISAAQQLISGLQTEVQNSTTLAKNTYLFNVLSFDDSVHSWGSTNMSFTAAQSAVTSVQPGLDTHLVSVMPQLATTIGVNGTGASSASPLKFMILVTDGLQSDRVGNYSYPGLYVGYDSAWNYNSTDYGGYAGTISQSQCNQIKSNGVVLAVLETPYVPLTGQDPHYHPYEGEVRHVLYPNGPSQTVSAASTALQSCATPGFYYQATSSSQIATGFLQLTNQFVAQSSYISK